MQHPSLNEIESASCLIDEQEYDRPETVAQAAFFFTRSLDLLSVIGLDGYFKRVNPAFTQTFGYSEVEFLACPFLDFVHPDDHPATLAEMEKLNKGEPTLYFENRYRTKDGCYRWLSWTASPQLDSGMIYCVARDTTEQKQAEAERRELEAALQRANQELEQRVAERTAQLEQANAALAEREALYRALTQHIPNGAIHLFDHDLRYLLMEGNELKKLGLDKAELVGKTIWEILPPETCEQIEPMYRAALRGEISVQEVLYSDQIYEVHTLPVRNEQGEIFAGMVLTQNMTHRKQAEAQLQLSKTMLQRQLTEIETIYQSAPIGLSVLDTDLRFLRINERLAQINGFSVEEHIGQTIRELLPDIMDTTEDLLHQVLETGEPLLNVEICGETPAQPGVKRFWLNSFLPLKHGDRIIGVSIVCEEITERKQIEIALRQFNLLIELSYEPIFVWNWEQGIINWNQGCEQLYGYSREEAIGQISHRLLQSIRPLPEAEFMAILERDRQWTGEVKHISRTGKQVIVESRQQLIEANGQRLVLETNRNITDRKQAEEALRQSEERYRTLFETMGDGFCIIQMVFDENNQPIDWCYLEVNPAFEEQSGFPQAEGKMVSQLIPNLEEFWFETYGKVALTGEPVRFENRAEVLNRWFEVYAFSVGQPEDRKIALLFKDISDRKQYEAALRENADRLRMAIASAELGTWDWDLVKGELKWDSNCKAMFGLPPDAESSPEVFFAGIHPDDRDRLQEIVQATLDPASGGFYDTEYRAIGFQDRVERWLMAKGQVYYDANGKPLRFIGTVLNITEQKQAEAQREQLLRQEQAARKAAEQANRIKDEFLAILSHELRTPLNPILGWAKLLQSPRISSEKLQQGLTTIERNAKQQTQMIEDLLDISRITQGKLNLNFASVRLSEPIAAALETVRLAAEAKAIKLEVFLDPMVEPVRGDAGKLQQMVWNLLTNAVKFTPTGGRVTVQLTQVDRYAQIQVSDTGRGIEPEFLPHVFELFRQEDSSITRSFGGLGLGLAIARQIIEAHGGTITGVSAGQGQGATFTVQLPLIAVPSVSVPNLLTKPALSLENLRALVVDDEADSLELVKIILEQEGAIVQAVSSASEALQLLSQSQFDLLISDIGMPEMNGYNLIREVRTLPPDRNQEIPAIALTAYAGETNHRQAIAVGFQSHLAKPINPQQLLDAIAKLTK